MWKCRMAGRAMSFLLIWRRNACWRINCKLWKAEEEKLADFAGHYEELLSEPTEEDREQPFVNEDAFVPAEVKGACKAGMLDASTAAILKKAENLLNQEKASKEKYGKTPTRYT